MHAAQCNSSANRQSAATIKIVQISHDFQSGHNETDLLTFQSISQHIDQNRTCVVQLERSRMWAFSTFNKQRVQNITSSEGYHRIYPSTADYSLMWNAKYEVSTSEY